MGHIDIEKQETLDSNITPVAPAPKTLGAGVSVRNMAIVLR
jgi:hypothetical protein